MRKANEFGHGGNVFGFEAARALVVWKIRNAKLEWSEWDERDRRQSCEERRRASLGAPEFHRRKDRRFCSRTAMTRAKRDCAWRSRLLNRSAVAVTIFVAWTSVAADQRQGTAFSQVTSSDSAAAQALANQLTALSPSVRPEEARRLADRVYAVASQLRREYGVIWPPLFNNFLVNRGIRKRGLCFQWAEDLLVSLDALKLTSLELHWGEAYAGSWQESNCVVVTAKGQPFKYGIILDCWRHSGHLYWRAAATDKVSWAENRAYARLVRDKLGAAHNRDIAVQTRPNAK
jgi:hypothetical protein